MPTCKMCLNAVSSLARCHIYPKAMSRYVADGGRAVLSSNRDEPISSWARGGMYDENIVCEACERAFLKPDTYGIEFWRSLVNATRKFTFVEDLSIRRYDADTSLLHMFFMQILLRAHYSDREGLASINLGSSVDALAAKILGSSPTIYDGNEIAIKFVKHRSAAGMFTPFLIPGEHPLYEIKLPHVFVYVAVDRKLPDFFAPIVLLPDAQVTVWHCRRLNESEIQTMMAIYEPNATRIAKILGPERSSALEGLRKK